MNAAQLHLLFNHLPVFGLVFGLLILLYAILKRSGEAKRLAFGIFVLTAVGTLPAYLSGEPAEEVVENVPGVSEALIEEHEESAVAALAAIEVLGALSLLGLFFSRKAASSAPALLVHGSLLLALVAFGLIAWTAHLGGQVHHPEIRAGAQWQAPEGSSEQEGNVPGAPGEESGPRGEVEDED